MSEIVIVHLARDDNRNLQLCDGKIIIRREIHVQEYATLCDDCWKISMGVHDVAVKYDAETMEKVHMALGKAGLTDIQILNSVTELQNLGILFRERV